MASGSRIFVTAAEVSGDLHAANLIRELRKLDPTLVIEGHGGPRMREAGCLIHEETTADAAMGVGAVARVREMFALLKWTRARFRQQRPDLLVCVDSPALNFHFAKLAKALPGPAVPVLQYVAPQLWAWREGRMKKVRRWIDKLACILPFEEAYFRGHGVDAVFVGHPLFDEVAAKDEGRRTKDEGGDRHEGTEPRSHEGPEAARDEATKRRCDQRAQPSERDEAGATGNWQLATGNSAAVGLLAGSRRSEAAANFPRMLAVAEEIRRALPEVRFLVPTTEQTDEVVRAAIERLPPSSILHPPSSYFSVERGAFDSMVPQCDLAITVSGTATLHVAIHGTPMIIVYAGSRVLWHALLRWVIRTRTYGLVNLLAADPALAGSGRVTPAMHAVPEHIPWYGSTAPVAREAIALLCDPARLRAQRAALRALVEKLGRKGASAEVASLALGMIGKQQPANNN